MIANMLKQNDSEIYIGMYQNRIHNNYHHLLTWLKLFADLSSRSTDWFFTFQFPAFQV
jgi:hypothetical protein